MAEQSLYLRDEKIKNKEREISTFISRIFIKIQFFWPLSKILSCRSLRYYFNVREKMLTLAREPSGTRRAYAFHGTTIALKPLKNGIGREYIVAGDAASSRLLNGPHLQLLDRTEGLVAYHLLSLISVKRRRSD